MFATVRLVSCRLVSLLGVDEWLDVTGKPDNGSSKKGTYDLYKGHVSRSQIIVFPIDLVHFEPWRRGQPL